MNQPFDNRRPTGLEEQAYAEIRNGFAEHVKQFSTSRDAIQQVERNLAAIAAAATGVATAPTNGSLNQIQADDGTQWHRKVELLDGSALFHRTAPGGSEFAVVELLALKSGEAPEIVARGPDVLEVLRAFARDQRQALQIWTQDVRAQVNEYLTEKYPGHDMSRVADGFINQCMQPVSQTQTHDRQQRHARGIRV